jgi:hypothetical protein
MGNSLLLFSGALPVILLYYTIVLCDLYDNFSKKTKKYARQNNSKVLKLCIFTIVFPVFGSEKYFLFISIVKAQSAKKADLSACF